MSQHWLFVCILYHLFKVNIKTFTIKILFKYNDPIQYKEIYLNLIIKLHNDNAYEYELIMYKIQKNCSSDIRINLGHQIIKFTKKEKKEIFLF